MIKKQRIEPTAAESPFKVGTMVMFDMSVEDLVQVCKSSQTCFQRQERDADWLYENCREQYLYGLVTGITDNANNKVRILQFKKLDGIDCEITVKASQLREIKSIDDKMKFIEEYVIAPVKESLQVITNEVQMEQGHPMQVSYSIHIMQAVNNSKPDSVHKYYLEMWRKKNHTIETELQTARPDDNTILPTYNSVQLVASSDLHITGWGLHDSEIALQLLSTNLPFRRQGYAKLLTGIVLSIAAIADVHSLYVHAMSLPTRKILLDTVGEPTDRAPGSTEFEYALNDEHSKEPNIQLRLKLWEAYQGIVETAFRFHLPDEIPLQVPSPSSFFKETSFYWNIPYKQATDKAEEFYRVKGMPQRFAGEVNPYVVLM